MLYAVKDNHLTRPRDDRDRAACPTCRAPVLARAVGSAHMRRHWAHFGDASCDYSRGGGPETEKHLGWKLLAQDYGCDVEVWQDGRRADAVTTGGLALEFQFRSLDAQTARAREKAHRAGWWVVGATVRRERVMYAKWVYGGNWEWGVAFDIGGGDDPGPVAIARPDRSISHTLDAEEFLQAVIDDDTDLLTPYLSASMRESMRRVYGRPVDMHGRPIKDGVA